MLLFIGFGIANVYELYMLQSYVTPALSATQAAQSVPLIQLAGLPAALIGMMVSGRWSDKIGRRKPFVVAASIIVAVSFLVPFVWPTVPAMVVQSVVGSFGLGVYIVHIVTHQQKLVHQLDRDRRGHRHLLRSLDSLRGQEHES